MAASKDRLSRLLDLVPYLLSRPAIGLTEVAADFAVTEQQLRDDLQLLFLCGLPGYGPGDLIDMSLDGDTVTVTYDAGIDRPLRLTSDEAFALLVALRALAEVPGLSAGAAVASAMVKLEAAVQPGAHADVDVAARVQVRTHANERVMWTVSAALERGRALDLTYYSATEDVVTERVVDPIRLILVRGSAYLEAWCRLANGVRLFHIDRIDAASELAEAARVPGDLDNHAEWDGNFRPGEDSVLVVLRVGQHSRWIAEYYPCEEVSAEADGTWNLTLRATNVAWARRLVLSLVDDVEILEPAELAHAVREHASAALARYAECDAE